MEKPKRNKIKTTTIKDGDRIAVTEYRHQFAMDFIEQGMRNIELEIASKKRIMNELIQDQALPQEPVKFMGIKIRRMQTEFNRLQRSYGLLERNNKPVKENSHSVARRDGKIK